MPAIYHTKVVDENFDGAVTHVTEATSPDDVVWHCQEADENYDGAIFHVVWAEQGYDGPLQHVVGIARVIEVVVFGVPPLSLPDALAEQIPSLIAYGGTEQRNLPTGYTQLEYIESTGTQYIDLGKISSSDIIDMKLEWTQVSNNYLLGSLEDGSNWQVGKMLGITYYILNSKAFYNRGATTSGATGSPTSISIAANTEYTIHWQPSSNQITVNGTQYTGAADNYNQTTDVFETANNLYLFCANRGGVAGSFDYVKMREFSIAGKRNLIPCRRNSDNVLGMYDTVSQTFFTNAGTGTFTAGSDVTVPTPDTPMDIISNNGALKVRHQSGLPLGYTLLEYIQSSGTQYIDTGITDVTDSEFILDAKLSVVTSGSFPTMLGATNATDSIYKVPFGETNGSLFYTQVGAGSNNYTYASAADTNRHTFKLTTGATSGGTLFIDNSHFDFNYEIQSDTTLSLYLFARNNNGSASNFISMACYGLSVKKSGVLVQNLIPCRRNSDNVLGMYDLVSGQFFTNAGTGTFTAGNTVSDPVEIYADGTVETINVHGKNWFDSSVFNTYVDTTPTYVSFQIPNGTYTMSTDFPPQPNTYYTNVWVLPGKVTSGIDSTLNGVSSDYPRTFTVTDGWYTVCYRSTNSNIPRDPKDYNWQVEQGSTATAYQPYNGGTATAEMLLKVGNYEDVQEILSGAVTRNVGVKVLDGTEDWADNGNASSHDISLLSWSSHS